MSRETLSFVHNGTCTMYCTLLTDVQIAKDTGYDAIEIIGSKLYRYLDQGYSIAHLFQELDGFPVAAVGYVQDIERQQPEEYSALLAETDRMCSLAEQLGAPLVQLLTGPIGPGIGETGGYQGLVGLPYPEVLKATAKNLRVLADIAASHNVGFYLEPLCWTPLHTLQHTLDLIDATERDNVGLVIDFWHQYMNGTTPDDLARLNASVISCVHVCDSMQRLEGPISHDLRNVWTGAGHIPLQDWVDAIRATGYDGWWAAELFSPKHWELDPWQTAHALRIQLEYLLA